QALIGWSLGASCARGPTGSLMSLRRKNNRHRGLGHWAADAVYHISPRPEDHLPAPRVGVKEVWGKTRGQGQRAPGHLLHGMVVRQDIRSQVGHHIPAAGRLQFRADLLGMAGEVDYRRDDLGE